MLGSTPFSVALADVLGDRLSVHPQDCARFQIAGRTPRLVISPRSVEEAAEAAAGIAAERASLVVRGAGTKSSRPPAPRRLDAVLDMSQCSGIVAHAPGDLSVTALGGTPISDLQAALVRHGQFFPCDVPFAARATIGGVLAANSNGALRLRYHALRDNVLQARVALSDGLVAKSGAKVVKSVAGYDAHKLFVGSWGTLGVIGEVTLKIAPMPATERLLIAAFASAAPAVEAAVALARSNLFVAAMTLHDVASLQRIAALRTWSRAGAANLIVRCGGNRGSVDRQVDAVFARVTGAGATATTPIEASGVAAAWSDIAELAGGAAYPPDDFIIAKFACLPAQTADLIDSMRAVWPAAEITAHPAIGVAFAHVRAAPDAANPTTLAPLWRAALARGWTAAFLGGPADLLDSLAAPLPAASPLKLMRSLKAMLDPAGAFDPGRFMGGI